MFDPYANLWATTNNWIIKQKTWTTCNFMELNAEEIENEVIKYSKFDIIIDDGSHNSKDIVRAFCNYFNCSVGYIWWFGIYSFLK